MTHVCLVTLVGFHQTRPTLMETDAAMQPKTQMAAPVAETTLAVVTMRHTLRSTPTRIHRITM